MKVTIDETICTGCGMCAETCPEIFELQDDLAHVKTGSEDVPEQYEDACREAADSCPVGAIEIE
ncbi:MAG: ferredoxin [Syntrophorhabdaceae bacterium]|nr:ferredoxin [Syntrophorhabdaceae bacterium]